MKKELLKIANQLAQLNEEISDLDSESAEELQSIENWNEWSEDIGHYIKEIVRVANSIILDPPTGTSFTDAKCPSLMKLIPMTSWKMGLTRASDEKMYFDLAGELMSTENALKWFEGHIPLYMFLRLDAYDKRGILETAEGLGINLYKDMYSFAEIFDYDELFIHCRDIDELTAINRDIEDYFIFHLMPTDAVRWAKKEIGIKELMESY